MASPQQGRLLRLWVSFIFSDKYGNNIKCLMPWNMCWDPSSSTLRFIVESDLSKSNRRIVDYWRSALIQTIQNNSSDNEIRLLSAQPSGVFYFVHMFIFKSCINWFSSGHHRAGKHQYSICCRTHTTYVQFIDFIGCMLARTISLATYRGFVRAAGLNCTAKCASMKPVPLARRG